MTLEQYNYYTKKAGIAEGIQLGLSQGIAQQKAEDEKIIAAERKKLSQQLSENAKLRAEIERLQRLNSADFSHS